MLAKRLVRYSILGALCFVTLLGSDCNWVWNFNIAPPVFPQNFAGTIETLAINQYQGISDLSSRVSNADGFAVQMKNRGWTQIARITDYDVHESSFGAQQSNVDALYFSGHGNVGTAALGYYNAGGGCDTERWGPASTSDSSPYSCLNYGAPFTGRMKWVVLDSSDSVAAPPVVDPQDPLWTANWQPIFGSSLHGLYGGWQAPGSCKAPQGTRTCDITDVADRGSKFGMMAVRHADGTNGLTVHKAWLTAVNQTNHDTGWAIWEDANAEGDIMSGPGDGSAPPTYASSLAQHQWFYYPANPGGRQVDTVPVSADTFALNPQDLAKESINDAGLAAQYASQSSVPVTVSDDGSVYSATSGTGSINHFYADSGEVVYSNEDTGDPIAFDLATAQQTAVNFVTQTLGMPSDAVLTSTPQIWQVDPSDGSAANVGWEFIWTHSNGLSGGDGIKVIVSDNNYFVSSRCSLYEYDPETRQRYCTEWSYTYADRPYVSYAYRLWRGLAGSDSNIQPVGQTSIDAQTAASALSPDAQITAYHAGLWAPDADTSSTGGARSAWIFTISGQTQVAVDAYTGEILGSISLQ